MARRWRGDGEAVTLRVIAGSWRGRRLIAPPGLETRPMPDRVKQAFFDWLGALDGLQVADVCAGSGTIACEALSRGAAVVHVIEPGRHAQSALRANAASLGNPPGWQLHARPFETALPGLHGLDVIVADPPFPWFTEQPALIATLMALCLSALARDGRIYVRGERGAEQVELPRGLRLDQRRFYGRSWIGRYTRAGAAADAGGGDVSDAPARA